MRILRVSTAAVFCCAAAAQNVPLEVSPGIGPEIVVASDDASVTVNWKDEAQREWAAVFRRDPAKAPIAAVRVNGRDVLRDARPFYRAETGKRRKGWNAFFDYPPAHPEGTQAWQGRLALKSIRVEGVGNRVRVVCRGFRLGIFSGDLVYTFFPASRLIRQEAVLSTNVPDTAYYYDAGLAFAGPRTRAPRTKHEHPASPITTRQGSCNRWLPTACSRSASLTRSATGLSLRPRRAEALRPSLPRINTFSRAILLPTWGKVGIAHGAATLLWASVRFAIRTGVSTPG